MRSTWHLKAIWRITFTGIVAISLFLFYSFFSLFTSSSSTVYQMLQQQESLQENHPISTSNDLPFPREYLYRHSKDAEIPRIIHQTYSTTHLPLKFAAWQKSCIDIHGPSWRYKLWTDADIDRLVDREFPWLKKRYSSFRNWINKVDLARYMILYKYGGFFIDLDIECLAPLDRFAQMGGAIIPRMSYNTSTAIPFWEHNFPNSLLGSIPRHVFWMDAMQLIANSTKQGVERVTGSIFLYDLIHRFKKIEFETADRDLPHLHIMDPGMIVCFMYW